MCSEKTSEFLAEKMPYMIKIAALIIKIDCLTFDQSQKVVRWVENDFEVCETLRMMVTYGNIDEDFDGFVKAKYSHKQFSLDFEQLFYADAKLYNYTSTIANNSGEPIQTKYEVHYAVFFESLENYITYYTSEGLFSNIGKIHSKKYFFLIF